MDHYHVFETKLGFAAVAWNEAGVTRFNLPGPRDGATNRLGGATPADLGLQVDSVASGAALWKEHLCPEEAMRRAYVGLLLGAVSVGASDAARGTGMVMWRLRRWIRERTARLRRHQWC